MRIQLEYMGHSYDANLDKPIDISIPLRPNHENPNCFYAPPPSAAPVKSGDFVGDIQAGGLVNFKNIQINPHGNGTHTECYTHISLGEQTINQTLKSFHFVAYLISVYPELKDNGDRVIGMQTFKLIDEAEEQTALPKACIIRTLPNNDDKLTKNYSGTNPPYVDPEFLLELRRRGVEHLLIDLPSIDKEQDGGALAGHKAFWGVDAELQPLNTITELIYVPSFIRDGVYLLQLGICPLEMDATPSKPILYELNKI